MTFAPGNIRIQKQVIAFVKRRDDDIQPVVVVHVYQSDVDGLLASRLIIGPADFFKVFAVDILIQLETVVSLPRRCRSSRRC